MFDNQPGVDPIRGEVIQHAIIGLAIDTPEPRAANVGDARRELEPEQVKNAEDRVGVAGCVGHDLAWPQFGFLVEHDGKQIEAVAQRAGHRQSIQPGKAIRNQIVPGDAAFAPEIARVWAGVDRADWHGETQSIGRGDLAAAPNAGQWYPVMGRDQQRVGFSALLGHRYTVAAKPTFQQ